MKGLSKLLGAVLFLLAAVTINTIPAYAQQHATHNMLLFGEKQMYASHLVYKVPHNFQVILQVSLPALVQKKIFKARKEHPEQQIVWLLDHMDIGEIQSVNELSGSVFRLEGNERILLAKKVTLNKDAFRVLYFDELPLSLGAQDDASPLPH